jgi:hypothetical protein
MEKKTKVPGSLFRMEMPTINGSRAVTDAQKAFPPAIYCQ